MKLNNVYRFRMFGLRKIYNGTNRIVDCSNIGTKTAKE